ncbi:hypothetical protein KAR91_72965 [Candidatus Pacearchaeota archaeon]|nr:hypothetical protein [Candidatus Pacearchaeota archaeon]
MNCKPGDIAIAMALLVDQLRKEHQSICEDMAWQQKTPKALPGLKSAGCGK